VRDRPVHQWSRGARARRPCAASITPSASPTPGREFRTGKSQGNLARTPDVAGITPLNNFLGPESDPVTADTQLPKYQSTN